MDKLQRKVATELFQSTVEVETADLISHTQMFDREREIDKLLM